MVGFRARNEGSCKFGEFKSIADLFGTPTSPQWWAVVKIVDYGWKERILSDGV